MNYKTKRELNKSSEILQKICVPLLFPLKIKNPLLTCVTEGFKYLGRDLNPYILTDTGF